MALRRTHRDLLALGKLREEAADKGVTSAVGVNNLRALNLIDRVLGHLTKMKRDEHTFFQP